VQRAWDRHDRLSVIGAVTLSPKRKRLGLFFSVAHENIRTARIVAFLKYVRLELRRPLIVVLDRLAAHRSAAKQLEADGYDDIRFEWLPAYAPDLNPAEALWSYTKYSDLANYLPPDATALRHAVCDSIERQRTEQSLLRSFFQAAELKL
jgi:transposase